MLLELRQLGTPRLGVDGQERVHDGGVDVEAARCRARRRPAPDRSACRRRRRRRRRAPRPTSAPGCSRRSPATGTSRRRPCGTSSPRRGGAAGRRRAGRSRASAGSSCPCRSRRTAASRTGRSAACRRRPAWAAVVSELMIEPRNTPCCQSKLSVTSGTLVARRPPKRIAEIGTPLGSSHSGAIDGHCEAGAVKRAFGWAAGASAAGVQSLPFQSTSVGGGLGEALPPHVAVVGQGHVGEDGVGLEGCDRRWGWCRRRCRAPRRRSPASGLMA